MKNPREFSRNLLSEPCDKCGWDGRSGCRTMHYVAQMFSNIHTSAPRDGVLWPCPDCGAQIVSLAKGAVVPDGVSL